MSDVLEPFSAPFIGPFETEAESRWQMFQRLLSRRPAYDAVVEFGVAGGDSIKKLADLADEQVPVYGLDTFTGLPRPWPYRAGYSVPAGAFTRDGQPPVIDPARYPNIRLIQGDIADTWPRLLNDLLDRGMPRLLLHVDVDLYESTSDILGPLVASDDWLEIDVLFDELCEFQPGGPWSYDMWREGEWRALVESGLPFQYIARSGHHQVALTLYRHPAHEPKATFGHSEVSGDL